MDNENQKTIEASKLWVSWTGQELEAGLYWVRDEAGGPTLYNFKRSENGEILVGPHHSRTGLFMEPDIMFCASTEFLKAREGLFQ